MPDPAPFRAAPADDARRLVYADGFEGRTGRGFIERPGAARGRTAGGRAE